MVMKINICDHKGSENFFGIDVGQTQTVFIQILNSPSLCVHLELLRRRTASVLVSPDDRFQLGGRVVGWRCRFLATSKCSDVPVDRLLGDSRLLDDPASLTSR